MYAATESEGCRSKVIGCRLLVRSVVQKRYLTHRCYEKLVLKMDKISDCAVR